MKGIKGLNCYRAVNSIILSMKFTPKYINMKEEEYYSYISGLEEKELRQFLYEVMGIITIDEADILAILGTEKDTNGVYYNKSSIAEMDLKTIINKVIDVMIKVLQIDIIINEDEVKKK